MLTPHVYWAQRHRELYLRVELSDVQVKAGLRAARRIGSPQVPVGRPERMPSCSAPAGAASGVPWFPRGLQVPSGVLRLVPVSPLFLAGTLGSRSGVPEAGDWPSGCLRPSELWDELRGSKVRRYSGLLGRGWTSALASEGPSQGPSLGWAGGNPPTVQ